jgi:hypothetical protein
MAHDSNSELCISKGCSKVRDAELEDLKTGDAAAE